MLPANHSQSVQKQHVHWRQMHTLKSSDGLQFSNYGIKCGHQASQRRAQVLRLQAKECQFYAANFGRYSAPPGRRRTPKKLNKMTAALGTHGELFLSDRRVRLTHSSERVTSFSEPSCKTSVTAESRKLRQKFRVQKPQKASLTADWTAATTKRLDGIYHVQLTR